MVDDRSSLRLRSAAPAAALACLALAGCSGGEPKPAEPPTPRPPEPIERVDSARSFEGEKRAVAAAVEAFETAVRRGDRMRLCERIVLARGDGFATRRNTALGACLRDRELAPATELREAALEARFYDLAVERVTVAQRKDRFQPDAVAFVRMPPGSANPTELFELRNLGGDWLISAHFATRVGEEPDVSHMACPDGSPSKDFWSHVFLAAGNKPVTAQQALLRAPRRGEIADESRLSGRLRWPWLLDRAKRSQDLVRVATRYGDAGVTYELRNEAGGRIALFELERFGVQYFNSAYSACPRLLAAAVGRSPTTDGQFVPSRAEGGAGKWQVEVSVAGGYGPVAFGVENLRFTGAGEDGPWLTHDLVIRNEGKERIALADTRTSAFALASAFADRASERLVVAMEGCGFAFNRPGGPAQPGACQLYLDAVTLGPGASERHRFSVFKGLAGIDPLVPGEYVFRHALRFRRGERAPTDGHGSRQAFRLTYLVTRDPG